MEQKVLSYIQKNKLIPPGQRVLVAVSGGADSMALLHFLWSFRDHLQCEVAAAHLHHGIRGKTADCDAQTVEDFCRSKNIPFYLKKVDVPKLAATEKIGLEAAGRRARYCFFDDILRQEGCDLLATAHHIDDQAETLLMRLIRGTGLKGACGILPKQNRIIRPFLCVKRKEIEGYCEKNGLIYQQDETNADLKITRNRLRHQVMPVLTDMNREASRHLSDFCEKAAETEDFLISVIDETERQLFASHPDHFEIEKFTERHPYLRKEVLRSGLARAGKTAADIEQRHIDLILEQLSKPATVWQLDLSNGVRVRREYGQLFFETRSSDAEAFGCYDLPLNQPGMFTFGNFRLKIEFLLTKELISSHYRKKRCEIYLNCDTIDKSICVRNRRPGDRIFLPGTVGHKKVKKLLIDRKIPLKERDSLPMIAVGRDILWIPGIAVDRRCIYPDPFSETTIKITMESLNEPGH